MTDQRRNTNGLKTKSTTKASGQATNDLNHKTGDVLPQTKSQNKDCRQWRSLCTQVALMDVRGSHEPIVLLLTEGSGQRHLCPLLTVSSMFNETTEDAMCLFCIYKQITPFPAFLWTRYLPGCGWMNEWRTVFNPDHKFSYCVACLHTILQLLHSSYSYNRGPCLVIKCKQKQPLAAQCIWIFEGSYCFTYAYRDSVNFVWQQHMWSNVNAWRHEVNWAMAKGETYLLAVKCVDPLDHATFKFNGLCDVS